MSIDQEFDPFRESLPAQKRLFYELSTLGKDFLQTGHDRFVADFGQEPRYEQNCLVNQREQRLPISLFTADEISLRQLALETVGTYGGYSGAVILGVKLYNDGSPHVLADDEYLLDTTPGAAHYYDIMCFAEHDPVVVADEELDRINTVIKRQKEEQGLVYPAVVPTAEEFLDYARTHQVPLKIVDEVASRQLIDVLQTGAFVPDYKEYSRNALECYG